MEREKTIREKTKDGKTKDEISLKAIGAKGTYILHIVDGNGNSIQENKIVLE